MESLKLMSAEEALKQWGCWVRSGRQLPGLTDTQRRSSGASIDLTDDEAVFIDRVVAQLKFRDLDMGTAVIRYHSGCLDTRALARVLDVGETKARTLLKAGEAWVDAVIQTSLAKNS